MLWAVKMLWTASIRKSTLAVVSAHSATAIGPQERGWLQGAVALGLVAEGHHVERSHRNTVLSVRTILYHLGRSNYFLWYRKSGSN
jgi:hypothetical protein